MGEKETDERKEKEPAGHAAGERPAAEEAERPAPGVRHEQEPDAENMMPAEDRLGTF